MTDFFISFSLLESLHPVLRVLLNLLHRGFTWQRFSLCESSKAVFLWTWRFMVILVSNNFSFLGCTTSFQSCWLLALSSHFVSSALSTRPVIPLFISVLSLALPLLTGWYWCWLLGKCPWCPTPVMMSFLFFLKMSFYACFYRQLWSFSCNLQVFRISPLRLFETTHGWVNMTFHWWVYAMHQQFCLKVSKQKVWVHLLKHSCHPRP